MALLGANTNIHAPPQVDESFAWRSRADELDAAKRRASTSFARLSTQPDSKAQGAAWAQDEIAVLRARVDLLNALMTNPDNARLCLDNDKPPRVCVMYNRMRCEGETELGPMQSTMAWAVRGAEKPVQHLMSTGELAQAGCVKDLLAMIKASMPRKDILQPLDTVLGLPPPERLVLKSVAGVNAQQAGHTRVIEGLGEAQGLAPLYQVVWGALDVAAHEAWQNPSTNAAIRLSILDTAHQVARDAARTKEAPWSSVAYLQVRICHGEECHVLSLTPFCDSESCTVTHLQYAQSVFDVHGPERGILNLAQDPASIHAIPGGKILPLQAYVCLGAHRKTRLSEAQLNYVHAQGLLAHGFDTRLLPPAHKLVFEANRMPAAKSTRVSATGLDVLASSYHIADQVYTTISVVQYPPFGTQFESKGEPVPSGAKRTGLLFPLPSKQLGVLNPDSSDFEPARAQEPDDDSEIDAYDDEKDRVDLHFVVHRRDVRAHDSDDESDEEPLYKKERVQLKQCLSQNEYMARCKPEFWEMYLCDGEHFFVDGVVDPKRLYDIDTRFVWFEVDNGTRYKKAEAFMQEIRDHLKKTQPAWDRTESFYWNIANNMNVGTEGVTAGQYWSHQWKQFIAHEVNQVLSNSTQTQPWSTPAFWHTHDTSQWLSVLPQKQAEIWQYMSGKNYKFYLDDGIIQGKIHSRRQNIGKHAIKRASFKLSKNQLPIPQRQSIAANNKPDPASVARLQTRISALETQLARARQDENTQFLLEKVLEKLDVVD